MTMQTSDKLRKNSSFASLFAVTSCVLGFAACDGSDDDAAPDEGQAGTAGSSSSTAGKSGGGSSSAGTGAGGKSSGGKSSGGTSSGGTSSAGTSSAGTSNGGEGAAAGNAPSDGGAPVSEGGASNAGAAGDESAGAGGEPACEPEPPQLPTDVPDIIAAPAGTTLVRHFQAVGTQNYRCTASADPEPVYSWVFVGPVADLLNSCGIKVGSHFAVPDTDPPQPAWRYDADGSAVKGVRVEGSPVGGAIPELLLKEDGHDGDGVFSTITFVQRLQTQGGTAPIAGCDAAHVGEQRNAGYLAEYYFYSGGT
jgi:hypothetical protein